jgi:ankyrin repeat protein
MEYAGFTKNDLQDMSKTFPPLLEMDVKRHLRPKLRFLKHTLEAGENGQLSTVAKVIPPHYFGSRLERTVAPRHAFLMHMGLPHGPTLLQNEGELFREFFLSHRKTKSFCAMCNKWSNRFGRKCLDLYHKKREDEVVFYKEEEKKTEDLILITPEYVDTFDTLFQRGLMAAARNDMDPKNQYLKNCNIMSDQMIHLLIRHGANPMETDIRDISLLHWAAGTGNKDGLIELARSLPGGFDQAIFKTKAERDGATILHWAATGAEPKIFGCGGHIDICRYIMDSCGGPTNERELVNALTKDGNSVLMWAAWSGTLDVVKLMIRHRADATIRNRNGCTVAHWAASGGNLDVCKYLYDVVKVDFSVGNDGGNTPLSHAVAYGRFDVAQWLRGDICVEDDGDRAKELAVDFVGWDTNDCKRQKIFNLFDDNW